MRAVANLARGIRPRWTAGFRSHAAAAGDTSPPPPASGGTGEASPPPAGDASAPTTGLQCGGFFFACDPNVGLWNDKTNPNWRFTFTDLETKEKMRVPYTFALQNQGPHMEFAIRLQFGYVSCEKAFEQVPQAFNVDSGWELSFPMPWAPSVRIAQTVVSADGVAATVSCVDLPVGLCVGFQQAKSGHGVKGINEPANWRNDGAMGMGGLAALFGAYCIVTLPWSWMEFKERWDEAGDAPEARLMFKLLDRDNDGFITKDDIRVWMQKQGIGPRESDAIFEALDTSGMGHISFEEFKVSVEQVMEAAKSGELEQMLKGQMAQAQQAQGHMQASQGMAMQQMRPFGGAFDAGFGTGMGPGMGPGMMGPGMAGPYGQEPRPPSW